jgi:glycosyltransferase involved in cell wall biosynthesis
MMRLGFISTRLAGTDGVSLETHKLAAVAREMGHEIFYCAGELDGHVLGALIPEIHFQDPLAQVLGERAFGGHEPDPNLEGAIAARAEELARPLARFLDDFSIDFLIAQNIFSIPMQLPLAQALAGLMAERGLPGLAHNHDFYWERPRFLTNRIPTFLDTYFPPALPRLQPAVINSLARQTLKERRGLDAVLIPNVFDFATPPPTVDEFSADFRQAIGLGEDDWLILQPTRVIPRKGIELTIELVARLADPRAKVVITHQAGDEGLDYLHRLEKMAQARGVTLLYVADMVSDSRQVRPDGRKTYALWDTYPHADLVAYPSLIEGFGNALLETIYFRRPALVNRYEVYAADIGPLGFQFAEIEGAITVGAVNQVRHWLAHPKETERVVEHNYNLGREHFSYQTLARVLGPIIGRGG